MLFLLIAGDYGLKRKHRSPPASAYDEQKEKRVRVGEVDLVGTIRSTVVEMLRQEHDEFLRRTQDIMNNTLQRGLGHISDAYQTAWKQNMAIAQSYINSYADTSTTMLDIGNAVRSIAQALENLSLNDTSAGYFLWLFIILEIDIVLIIMNISVLPGGVPVDAVTLGHLRSTLNDLDRQHTFRTQLPPIVSFAPSQLARPGNFCF